MKQITNNWKKMLMHLLLALMMTIQPITPHVIHGVSLEDTEIALETTESDATSDLLMEDAHPDEATNVVRDDEQMHTDSQAETVEDEAIEPIDDEAMLLEERGQELEDALEQADLEQVVDELNEQDYAHIDGFVLFNINGEQLPSPRSHVVRHQRFLGTTENSRYFLRHVPGFWGSNSPTNQGNGWRMQTWQININGIWLRAFCTQPGVSSAEPGHNYLPNWNPSNDGLTLIQRQTIGAILTHGYRNFHRPPTSNSVNWDLDARSSDDAIMVTQIMIQEVAAGHWNLNNITLGTRSPINNQGVNGDPWRRLIADSATSNGMQGGPTWQVTQGIGGAWFNPQPAVGNTRRMEMYDSIRHDVYFFHRRRNTPRGTRRADQSIDTAATHTLTWSNTHQLYRVEIDDRISTTGGTGTLRRFMGNRTSGSLGGGYRFCRGTHSNGVCNPDATSNRLWIYTTNSNAQPMNTGSGFLRWNPTSTRAHTVSFYAHPIYQNKVVGQLQDPFDAHFRVQVQPRIPPEISILKRSYRAGNPPLAGATFRIRRLTTAGNWSEASASHVVILGGSADSGSTTRRITGSNGTLRFTNLSFGRQYEICEISPPPGYQLSTNNCHTFTSGTGSGTVYAQRVFTNVPIPRRVVARHINANNYQEVLGTNDVHRPGTRTQWWDGDLINGASTSRTFPRLMPDGTTRSWRYEPTQTIGNHATVNGNMTITHHYSRPVLVRIRHIDRETNDVILVETENQLYEGDRLGQICPADDLTSLAGYLIVSDDDCIEIPRLTEDVEIDFYYNTPTLTLNVERLEITTGQIDMQAELIVSRHVTHEFYLHPNLEYRIVLTNEVTTEQTELPWRNWNGEHWASNQHREIALLPTGEMALGASADIRVTIEIRNNPSNRPNRFETQSQNLITQGYRASERVITLADFNNKSAQYVAVARTIATRQQDAFDVVRRMESLSINDFNDSVRQRTGYGIETNLAPTFISEIGDVLGADGQPDLQVDLIVPTSLVDTHVDEAFVQTSQAQTRIGLDVIHRETMGNHTQTTTLAFSHPQIWVQRGQGELFTQAQVDANHPAIHDLLRDGGRQFYIPIWHDLGDYTFTYRSQDGVGRNLITLEINWQLEVFANMYGWMGSPTLEKDMLLLQPILSDKQIPDGWSDTQIQWLRDNQ